MNFPLGPEERSSLRRKFQMPQPLVCPTHSQIPVELKMFYSRYKKPVECHKFILELFLLC